MIAIITLLIELVMLALINQGQISNSISNATASTFILLFSFSFFIAVQASRRMKLYKSSLMMGYLLRVFLLFFDIFGRNIYVLPHSAADTEMFYRNMVYYSQGVPYRNSTFVNIMGTVFKFIGTNRLYGQFLNMLFSVVALVFLAFAFNELKVDDRVKHRVYTIVCLLPNYAILSSIFLREAPVSMFLTISFYFILKWYMYKREKFFLFAAFFIFPAAALHSGSIAVLAGYIIIRVIYDNDNEKIGFKFRNVVVSVVVVGIIVFVLARTGDRFLLKFTRADTIEDIANTRAEGGSSYAQYVGNSDNLLSMIIYTIPRVFYFVFSPLPWQWRGLNDIIMFFFSSMVYLVTVWKMFVFLHGKDKYYRSLVIGLFIVAMTTIFVFAWGTSNVGTASRHRDKIITLFALILALSKNGTEAIPLVRKDKKGV